MADEGGSENENSKNMATMYDLKQLDTSMMSKFEEMITMLQSLKPNPMVALATPPNHRASYHCSRDRPRGESRGRHHSLGTWFCCSNIYQGSKRENQGARKNQLPK